MKHVVVCILGWAITACAPSVPLAVVTPAPKSAREPKPAADVANEGAVTPRDGAGAIVLTRRKTWLGRGCTFDVALDDQHVAGLRPGERLTLYADPGQRTIDVSIRDEDGCDPANAHVALDVVPHATNRIQLRSDGYYDLKVEVNSYGASLPR